MPYAVLVGFCAMAASLLPREALLGRLGGEEFACLLPDVSPAEALARAEELRRTFAELFVPELPDLRVSVSIGIAQIRRGTGPNRRTKIIGLTAAVGPVFEQQCREAGMDEYLGKPVQRAALLAMLGLIEPARPA